MNSFLRFPMDNTLSMRPDSEQDATVLRVKASNADRPRPTVTVVIPCFNYARYLPAAVESVLSQEGVDVDVVVVDDGSTDESMQVALQFALNDPRVRVIAHDKNAGPVQTFNDGLAVAEGEFLVRLDADDILTPGALQRATDVMHSFPSVGLVYGHPIHFSGDNLPSPRTTATRWTIWPGRKWLAARCQNGCNVITSPEVVMRRSVVDQVGGQRELAHTHDMEMWLRLSAFADVAYIHGADQAWHREHSKSLSASVDDLRDFHERRAAFDVLFGGVVGAIPESETLRKCANFALARHCLEVAIRLYDHRHVDMQRVKLMAGLAREVMPNVEEVPGWRALERRMAVGPGIAARHPIFVLERIYRGLRGRWHKLRWHRAGY
jgi:glycosyltransferase involved in cell wall biosynthesis